MSRKDNTTLKGCPLQGQKRRQISCLLSCLISKPPWHSSFTSCKRLVSVVDGVSRIFFSNVVLAFLRCNWDALKDNWIIQKVRPSFGPSLVLLALFHPQFECIIHKVSEIGCHLMLLDISWEVVQYSKDLVFGFLLIWMPHYGCGFASISCVGIMIFTMPTYSLHGLYNFLPQCSCCHTMIFRHYGGQRASHGIRPVLSSSSCRPLFQWSSQVLASTYHLFW